MTHRFFSTKMSGCLVRSCRIPLSQSLLNASLTDYSCPFIRYAQSALAWKLCACGHLGSIHITYRYMDIWIVWGSKQIRWSVGEPLRGAPCSMRIPPCTSLVCERPGECAPIAWACTQLYSKLSGHAMRIRSHVKDLRYMSTRQSHALDPQKCSSSKDHAVHMTTHNTRLP